MNPSLDPLQNPDANENGDAWYEVEPPNLPLLKCELGEDAIEYVWQLIDEAKAKEVEPTANQNLAGNIEKSLYLDDKDNYFFNTHLKTQVEKYVMRYAPYIHTSRNPFSTWRFYSLTLREFWVNFQNQIEFNPIHSHAGVLSFVIWLNIPTEYEDQEKIPFCASANSAAASDFNFVYTDIMGGVKPYTIKMGSDAENTMFVFPSLLNHQVYPFYQNDGKRISVSGNIYYDLNFDDENQFKTHLEHLGSKM